jgi:hypothetical protein
LYDGSISLEDWQVAIATEIKERHINAAMIARGGRQKMTSIEWGRIGGNLADEFRHLQRFAEGITRGEVPLGSAISRANQYGNAVEQAYWKEWGRVQDRPGWAALPALNQVPRDGRTKCHGNCGCQLETHADGIHWVLGKEKNCKDCPRLAAEGPYRPGRL